MKKLLSLAATFVLGTSLFAQGPVEIRLWPDGAPNSNGLTGPENQLENGRVDNITDPVMYVYPADAAKNTGAAVILCPGGGYVRLAMNHEGHEVARWLASNGITGVVLKYRMPNGHADVPLSDAHQAIRLVRTRAAEWGVNPKKVGIGGNSAGGHLAATAATHFDPATRPDFAVLFYPVVSLVPPIAHAGSGRSLLGDNAPQELRDHYSNELQVTAQTPPTILFHSDDDRTVPALNSVVFYEKMKENKVPGALYIFPQGGHGWGFNASFRYHEAWKALLLKWLEDMKFTAE
jgi:acetyl esterase/lipase